MGYATKWLFKIELPGRWSTSPKNITTYRNGWTKEDAESKVMTDFPGAKILEAKSMGEAR